MFYFENYIMEIVKNIIQTAPNYLYIAHHSWLLNCILFIESKKWRDYIDAFQFCILCSSRWNGASTKYIVSMTWMSKLDINIEGIKKEFELYFTANNKTHF